MTVGTAFHPRTSGLNQKLAWGEWSGYLSAQVYSDFHDIEYNAIREAVAVIDVSPLYKYVISGPDSMRLVDRVITRDATKLAVGRVFYTPWCDERGRVIDDGTVTRREEQTYFWTAADPSYRWFTLNAHGLDVSIRDVSEDVAALALQGPSARQVLEAATRQDWADLRYFRHRRTEVGGIETDVTRTGYTGDLGYELWVPAADAVRLWDALFEAGRAFGIRPVGMQALDVLRVEAGLILLDAEFTGVRNAFSAEQEYSPFELGLGRLVNLEKPRFVGKRALLEEQAAGGPPRRLVGMELDWDGIEAAFERHGVPTVLVPGTAGPAPVFDGRRQVGKATSMTWSPTLKRVIALGLVDAAHAADGSRLDVEWTVEGTREKVVAKVVPLPFFDPPRKRE